MAKPKKKPVKRKPIKRKVQRHPWQVPVPTLDSVEEANDQPDRLSYDDLKFLL